MFLPLLSALLVSTSLIGSWRVVLEGSPEASMHLVIRDQDHVELYNEDWSPASVVEFKVGGDTIFVRTLAGGTLLGITLQGEAVGDFLSGETISQAYIYTTEGEFRANRVSPLPFTRPPDWVSEVREEGIVDIVGYLAKHAPKESFDAFERFWKVDAEQRFYMFVHTQLFAQPDGEGSETVRILHELFESLPGFTPEVLRAARLEALDLMKGGEDKKVDSVVLVPSPLLPLVSGPIQLASLDNPDACCGAPSYFLQDFVYLPVEPEGNVP